MLAGNWGQALCSQTEESLWISFPWIGQICHFDYCFPMSLLEEKKLGYESHPLFLGSSNLSNTL